MKTNALGNWLKDSRITIRMPEAVRDVLDRVAVESRSSAAEVALNVLTDWAVRTERGLA
jgi:hypothetical protein